MPGQALPSAQQQIFLTSGRDSKLAFKSEQLMERSDALPRNIEKVVADLRVAYFFAKQREDDLGYEKLR